MKNFVFMVLLFVFAFNVKASPPDVNSGTYKIENQKQVPDFAQLTTIDLVSVDAIQISAKSRNQFANLSR